MSRITELGYVRFGVSDLDAWRAFAADLALEIVPDEKSADRFFLRMDLWHHRIIVERSDADDLLAAGLRCAGPHEFRELQDQLSRQGIDFEVADRATCEDRHVLEMMMLREPSGTPIEIFHGPQVDTHRPFHPASPRYGRFVTGAGGAGHLMLSGHKVAESCGFCESVGMRGGLEYRIDIGDAKGVELYFYHCNERDHTLAFGWASDKVLQHMMLEVDCLDDVFITYERIKEKHPIFVEPGKHANDEVFSFYCRSPSGFMIEVGCHGSPAKHQTEYYVMDTFGHALAEAPAED